MERACTSWLRKKFGTRKKGAKKPAPFVMKITLLRR
jgi:hypothetical protein